MVGTAPAGRRWAGVVGGVALAPDGEAVGATASALAAAVLGAVGAAASTAAALGAVDAASSAPAAAALGGVVTPEAGAARRVYTAPKRPRGGGAGAWRATVERPEAEGGAAADEPGRGRAPRRRPRRLADLPWDALEQRQVGALGAAMKGHSGAAPSGARGAVWGRA